MDDVWPKLPRTLGNMVEMDSSRSSVLDISLECFHVFVLKHGDYHGEDGAQIQMKMKSMTVARARIIKNF